MKKILTIVTLSMGLIAVKPLQAQPLSGTINLPKITPPTLLTLGAAINHLNNYGISGPLVINCSSNETAPSGGFSLGCSSTLRNTMSAVNTITIDGKGKTFTAPTGTGNMDAIFSLQGMIYVTLKNFNFVESSTNTTSTTMMERGISIVKCSKDTGSKKLNILNSTITLNNTNTNGASVIAPAGVTGVFVGNCTSTSNSALSLAASEEGTNDGIYIANCKITNVNHGVYIAGIQTIGDGTSFNDKNMTLNADTIENFTHHGVYLSYSNGDLVNGCRIINTGSSGTAPTNNSIFGIRYNNSPYTFVTNSGWDCTNNTIKLTTNTSGGYHATGIFTQINGSSATYIQNDTVELTSSGTSAQLIGIMSQNSDGSQVISKNNLRNFTTQTTNTQPVIGVYAGGYNDFSGLGVTNINGYPKTNTISDNIFKDWSICGGTTSTLLTSQIGVCLEDNLTTGTTIFTGNTIRNIVINNNSVRFGILMGTWRYGPFTSSPVSSTVTVSNNTVDYVGVSAPNNTTPIYGFELRGAYPACRTVNYSGNKIDSMRSGSDILTIYSHLEKKLETIDKDTVTNLFSDNSYVIGSFAGYYTNLYPTNDITIMNTKISGLYGISVAQGVFSSAVQLQHPSLGQTSSLTIKKSLIEKIYNSSTAGLAFGINTPSGGNTCTYNISNTIISDVLDSNNKTNYCSSFGVNLNNAGTNNIYFNTVKLKTAASAGSGFGATGLYYNTGATNKIQNNILHVNVVADTALNNVAAIRSNTGAAKTAVSKINFEASSNIYYCPTGYKNFLYVDGTTNSTLVNGYHISGLIADSVKNIVNDTFFNSPCDRSSYHKFMAKGASGREVNTYSENNLSGSPLSPSGASFAESHATDGPISEDFIGDPRPYGSSDIGALEFKGSLPPQMIITVTSSTGFDTACTYNLPTLIGSIPSYFTKVSYQWYRDTTKLIGRTTRTLMVSPVSGMYVLKVYDSVTGCEYASDPFPITIVPPPPAKISYYDSLIFCETSAIVLQANKGYNYIYQWSRNGVDLPGETNDHIVADKSGDYRVRINTPLGCPTTSGYVRIKVYPLPTPTVIYGGPGKLSTQKYFTYQWYKNNVKIDSFANARDFYTLFSGDGAYSVEVTDSNGCTAKSDVFLYTSGISTQSTQAATIRIYPNPVQDILNIESPIAVNISLSDVSGRVVLQAQNAQTINLDKLQAGMYLLSIADAEGKLIKMEKITKLK